jgi:hypothetical protein
MKPVRIGLRAPGMAAKGFAERLVAGRGTVGETLAELLLRPPIIAIEDKQWV